MKKVAIIGLGYVGLPLALLCAKKGFSVIGLDASQRTVATLKSGKSHIKDDTVEKLLIEAFESSNFQPTTTTDDIKTCDIYLICVPSPIDENQEPDLQPLESTIQTIAPYIEKGDLVVVESTVFPGNCEQVVIPALEKLSNLEAGIDFHVAHCPERVNPGDLFWTFENIPRVVGATSETGVKQAAKFFASILGGDTYDVREIKIALTQNLAKLMTGVLKFHIYPLVVTQ